MTLISLRKQFLAVSALSTAFRSQIVRRIWSKSLGTRILRTTVPVEIT